jgi:hypothetical protein
MRQETKDVGFATGIGCMIGGFGAAYLAARFGYTLYFGIIGAIVGGLVAYFIVDAAHFVAGVRNAAKATIAWRPDPIYWKSWLIHFLGWISFNSSIALLLGFVVDTRSIAALLIADTYIVLGFSFMSAFMVANSRRGRDETMTEAQWAAFLKNRDATGWKMIKWGNPIGAIIGAFIVCGMVIRWAMKVARKAPAAIRILKAFAWKVFVNVHKTERTISFAMTVVFVLVGFAIGYATASPIAGAFVGALLGPCIGIAYCELVVVRYLKLVPGKRS